MKQSRFWLISKEDLQELFDSSRSISDVISKMGVDNSNSWYRRILNNRITQENISLEVMKKNYINFHKQLHLKHTNDEVFVKNSKYGRAGIKRRIIESNLITYKCGECGIIDEYNNKPITLDLDHINGIRDDNRLENLRFLCPNCHSQENTSNGKNKIKTTKYCECGNVIAKTSTHCKKCSNSKNIKHIINPLKFEVTKEELERLILQYPMTEIGKIFGVSDNAIRKRCNKLKIEF